MAITEVPTCNVETNVIQNLADNPNESGLDANDLKEAFDEDARRIKEWLNNYLKTNLDSNISALNSDSSTLNGKIGDLSNLNTTSTNNLVSAINEVNTNMSTNKVLWTGTWKMDHDKTIVYKDNGVNTTVSAQKNGIVLVWSYYDNNNHQESNSNFNLTFIPKQFVTLFDGYGVTSLMSGTQGGSIANKYVYVHNTHITGHDANLQSTAGSYVLRAIIGV